MVGWWIFPRSYPHQPALTNIWFEGTSCHGSAALNGVQLDFGMFFGVISLRSFSSPLIPVEVLVASCLQGLSEPAKSCLKFFVMILGEPQLLPEDLYYPWPSQPIFSAPISCEQRYDTEVLVTCLDHHSLAVTSNIAGFEMKNPSNLRLRDPSEQRWVNDK